MKLLTIFLATTALFSLASGQASKEKNVRVSAKAPDKMVQRGDTFRAEVKLTIAKGWHINSHSPSQEYMIGTSLEMDSTAAYAVSGIRYPEGRSVKLSISETPFSLYDGTITIGVTIRVGAEAPKGKQVVRGTITFQACNDKICVAPSTVPVEIPITVGS